MQPTPIEEVWDSTYNYYRGDYENLVESLGVSVVVWVRESGYEGDTFAILNDEELGYGYLSFGWGSCSGCDALEAATSAAALGTLRDELMQAIRWESSAEALLKYLRKHDVEGTHYSYRKPEYDQMVEEFALLVEHLDGE